MLEKIYSILGIWNKNWKGFQRHNTKLHAYLDETIVSSERRRAYQRILWWIKLMIRKLVVHPRQRLKTKSTYFVSVKHRKLGRKSYWTLSEDCFQTHP